MTESERAAARKYIAIWRETAVELDRMKWDELRSLTERQAAEYFAQLDPGAVESLALARPRGWQRPRRAAALVYESP